MNERLIENKVILKKDLITVIIPTLLKSNLREFLITLTGLSNCSLVKEILIFDNTLGGFKPIPELTKIKVVNKENKYVNPAWNMGVSQCKTDYYLLLNDDVILDEAVLYECVNALVACPEYDLLYIDVGLESPESYFINVPKHNEFVKVIDCLLMSHGCFMMGRTNKYIPIPEDLKIFWGDYWLFERLRSCKILSTYVSHRPATTVRALDMYMNGTLDNEKLIFDGLRG